MFLKFGNMSPVDFEYRVDTVFLPEERSTLQLCWSRDAQLTGPDQFHIFTAPVLQISVGSADSPTLEIFVNANRRKQFNREVSIFVDDRWRGKK